MTDLTRHDLKAKAKAEQKAKGTELHLDGVPFPVYFDKATGAAKDAHGRPVSPEIAMQARAAAAPVPMSAKRRAAINQAVADRKRLVR